MEYSDSQNTHAKFLSFLNAILMCPYMNQGTLYIGRNDLESKSERKVELGEERGG